MLVQDVFYLSYSDFKVLLHPWKGPLKNAPSYIIQLKFLELFWFIC